MKNYYKLLFLMGILFFGKQLKAQTANNEQKKRKYEIGIDLLKLVNPNENLGLSISLDYIFDKNQAIDLSGDFQLGNNRIGVAYKYYFGKKYAQGLYSRTGFSYNYGEYMYLLSSSSIYQNGYYQNLSLDIDVGYKIISKNNIYLDGFIGSSRVLFGTSSYNTRPYKRKLNFGIKLGKRF